MNATETARWRKQFKQTNTPGGYELTRGASRQMRMALDRFIASRGLSHAWIKGKSEDRDR